MAQRCRRRRGSLESRCEQFCASADFGCGLETLRPLADDLSVHTQILLLCELYLESARHDQRCPFYPLCVLADSRCGIDSLRRGDGQWAAIAAMANNALSFYLIFELTKRARPVFFSMINYVENLTGMDLGIWLFSDARIL